MNYEPLTAHWQLGTGNETTLCKRKNAVASPPPRPPPHPHGGRVPCALGAAVLFQRQTRLYHASYMLSLRSSSQHVVRVRVVVREVRRRRARRRLRGTRAVLVVVPLGGWTDLVAAHKGDDLAGAAPARVRVRDST